MSEIDYVPRAYNLLIIADFPVVLASAPLGAVIKSKLVVRVLFVVMVAFFWYWIGRGLERRWNELEAPPNLPSKFGLAANLTGFVVSGAMLVLTLWSDSGPMALLVYGAVIGWSAGFMVYFAMKAARVWLSSRRFQ